MADIGRLMNEQKFASLDEINSYLEQMIASEELIPPGDPISPLERARELMYDACETTDSRQRIKLTRKALAISEDCADA